MKGKKLLAMFLVALSMVVTLNSSVTATEPAGDLTKIYYLNFDLPCPYPEPVIKENPSTAYVIFSSESGKIVKISGEWAPERAIIHYAIFYGEHDGAPSSLKKDLRQTGIITNKDSEEFKVMEGGTYTLFITQIDYPVINPTETRVVGYLKIVVPELYSW